MSIRHFVVSCFVVSYYDVIHFVGVPDALYVPAQMVLDREKDAFGACIILAQIVLDREKDAFDRCIICTSSDGAG